MIAFGYEFKNLDEEHERDLFNLEREGAVYADQWVDELQDFRHVRIPFQPAEIKEYVRSLKAWDLFLGSGEKWARDIEGIPADIAERADAYEMRTVDGDHQHPWHCPAGFMGEHLEDLLCSSDERRIVIEQQGIESWKSTVVRAIDSLTPSIRSLSAREKGLENWAISREDDVRDLLYIMLRSSIDDIQTEEPIPSRAGTYKFVDLFSSTSKTLIEVKWIGKKGQWKKIIEQINIDIQSYITHPACETIFFVIVDSVRDFPDPRLVERQLTGKQTIDDKEVDIHVFIREP